MKLLRSTIELTNRLYAQIRSNRRVKVPAGFPSVRLNLGCGLAVTEGWINIDGSLNALVASLPKPLHRIFYRMTGAKQFYSVEEYCRLLGDHVFLHHNLAAGIPLHNSVADYIYSSHFFEHLYRSDARHLLQECHRVLKLNGILRISIPDLAYAISLYSAARKDEMLQMYFFIEEDDNQYSRHKYMYDFEMLSSLMREMGFRNIVKCQYREGEVPDITVLDNRPEDSLFIEAMK